LYCFFGVFRIVSYPRSHTTTVAMRHDAVAVTIRPGY
jgi:hypothetical protein